MLPSMEQPTRRDRRRGDGMDRDHDDEPRYSFLSHLECPRCGHVHDADVVQQLCSCGSPLLARYDLARIGNALSPADLRPREPSLWRYHELLPVRDPAAVTTLGEGMT